MTFEIRAGTPDDVDRLEELWYAMRDHHAGLGQMPPVRPRADSWAHRRGQYREWIGGDEHELLLAERDGEPIGYAVVSFGEGAATWELGTHTAEIETLSVLAAERGAGVGRALTEAAIAVAREHGAETILVAAAHSNVEALRFYEREGFDSFYVLLTRPLADGSGA